MALSDKYTAVVTNPPYMGSGSMNALLSSYVKKYYEEGKADLFSTFMIVAVNRLMDNGKYGMINMHSWMFLSSFERLRRSLLDNYHIDSLLHLGPHTFDELSGEVVQNAAYIVTKHSCIDDSLPEYNSASYYRLVNGRNCSDKERMFLNAYELPKVFYPSISQSNFENIPGNPIGYWLSNFTIFDELSIEDSGYFSGGRNKTHDNDKYVRFFWEVNSFSSKWHKYANAGGVRKYSGIEWYVVDWSEEARNNYDSHGGLLNPKYWEKKGITWNLISPSIAGFSLKSEDFVYSSGSPTLFNADFNYDYYLLGFLNSKVASYLLKLFNPTINTTAGDVLALPLIHGEAGIQLGINAAVKKSVEKSKLDWDAHETSWDFKENELFRIYKENRGEGVFMDANRLEDVFTLYREYWTAQFNKLHENEEELNRQFIEIYGLQDELTPDVSLDEITILQQGEISIEDYQLVWHNDVLAKQLLSYAIGCMMGRYRLDRPGLHIAYPNPSSDDIAPYDFQGESFEIDDDGIIPLLSRDCPFDDNAYNRVVKFIRQVFGESFLNENLNFIEASLGSTIEDYFVKDFWKDHKKMYSNRPIYWLFSSKKGAFQCLTYMHRMTPYTAEAVRSKYLLPYIDFLKNKIVADMERASSLSTVERRNLDKMQKALDECLEYEEILHDVADRQIRFDLDDGVVVNYAKFGDALAKIK